MELRRGAFPRRRAVALAIAATLAAAAPAGAATITVNSLLDGAVTADANCTLREALASLDGGAAVGGCAATGVFGTADTIRFGVSGTITLDPVQGALDVTSDSTITGPGASQLTISGGDETAAVYVTGASAEISGVTITNGAGGKGAGGVTAIYSQLALRDCTISDNTGGLGGGVLGYGALVDIDRCTITGNSSVFGGAVSLLYSAGTVTNATITGNSSSSFPTRAFVSDRAGLRHVDLPQGDALLAPDGFGLPPGIGAGVAAFANFGNGGDRNGVLRPRGIPLEVTIADSTISGNTAASTAGGIAFYAVPAVVSNTTISGNSAPRGGGFAAGGAPLAIEQSTISGNAATGPGGKGPGGGNLIVFGSGPTAIPVDIASSTITGNTAVAGPGGVVLYGNLAVEFSSTIVANSSGTDPADVVTAGTTTPVVTRSLVENPGASGISAAGDNLVGVDPQLGPLANNGGPTPTHLPAATSPVVDAGANPTGAQFDQRGAPFARVVGAGPDIGSVERGAGGPVSFVANVPATSTWGAMLLAAAMAALAWTRRPRRARRAR